MINLDSEFCCECGHNAHRMRLCDAYRSSVSIEISAPDIKENILSRITSSLYYVFTGHEPGHWASFILRKSDIPQLVSLLQKYMNDSEQD